MNLSNLVYIAIGFLIPYSFYYFYFKKVNKKIDVIESSVNESFIISELKDIRKKLNNYVNSVKFNNKLYLRVIKLDDKIVSKIDQLIKLK